MCRNLLLAGLILLVQPLLGQIPGSSPVLNTLSGEGFESLGEAIAAANPGDELVMAEYRFVEHVHIDLPLTLVGANAGTSVIDVSEEDGWGITLSSDGITLKDLTVVGGGSNTSYAIHSEPGITDLTLDGITVVGSTRSCIDLNGLTGPGLNTIRNIDVSGSAIGFGLAFSTCSNLLVENVTSSDNGFGDIAIMESNYYEQEIHDVVFMGSLDLEGPESLGGGGLIVQVDPAQVPVGIGPGFPVSMNADGYDYLLEAPGELTGCILVHNDDVRAIAANLGANVSPLVAFDLVTQDLVVFPGMLVQSALDFAEDGDVIKVEAGAFDTAPLEISGDVTLMGPNAGISGVSTQNREAEAILPGIAVVSGSPVIDGVRIAPSSGIGLEVRTTAAGVTLRNSVLKGGGEAGSSGVLARKNATLEGIKVTGFAEAVWQEDGQLTLVDSRIQDYLTGLTLDLDGADAAGADIQGTTFESSGDTGIRLMGGGETDSFTMTGSTLSLHDTAFLVEQAEMVSLSVTGNTFSDSEYHVEGMDRDGRIALCSENAFDPVLRITGCTDAAADNYETCASIDEGCEYLGCTAPKACNFDATANVDDGSCDFVTCSACPLGFACNYDPDASLYRVEACSFTGCDGEGMSTHGEGRGGLMSIEGCTIPQACNYDATADTEDGSCTFDCYGCMDVQACNYDGAFTQASNETCLFIADLHGSPHVDCDGVCMNDLNANGICDEEEVTGCMDAESCNFNADATLDEGCEYESCKGCLNPAACNHDPLALISDGSCDYSSCEGCTDVAACNYSSGATLDDASCIYPIDLYNKGYLDCDAGCINDADGDGVCDEEELMGCTDQGACNYDEVATDDDGTCDFSTCAGCTDVNYCNFNPSASIDNGTCASPADLYPASVIDGQTTVDCLGRCINDENENGICDEFEVPCPGDLNGDGLRGAADILILLGAFGCDAACGDPDLNGDGLVGASDILMALSNFGLACTP